MTKFNVPLDLIRGHQEISPHKVDPGAKFNRNRFKRALSSTSVPVDDFPSGGELVDEDGDGIIYLDETDDVRLPSGRDQGILNRLFDFLAKLFGK